MCATNMGMCATNMGLLWPNRSEGLNLVNGPRGLMPGRNLDPTRKVPIQIGFCTVGSGIRPFGDGFVLAIFKNDADPAIVTTARNPGRR